MKFMIIKYYYKIEMFHIYFIFISYFISVAENKLKTQNIENISLLNKKWKINKLNNYLTIII